MIINLATGLESTFFQGEISGLATNFLHRHGLTYNIILWQSPQNTIVNKLVKKYVHHRHFALKIGLRFSTTPTTSSNGNHNDHQTGGLHQGTPRASRQCSSTSLKISSASLNKPGEPQKTTGIWVFTGVLGFLFGTGPKKGFLGVLKWNVKFVDLNNQQQKIWSTATIGIIVAVHSVPFFGDGKTSTSGNVNNPQR